MPPSGTKANYKTYEAQARLVRAIVAAHPEVKWNYKEIVACYGSDMTEHALNHRFRRLRAQSLIVREGLKLGLDMKNLISDGDKGLPATQEAVDKQSTVTSWTDNHHIAKYFGQSTADGIHFQFRAIKKDANQLREVEKNGGDVASCLSLGGGSSSAITTPSKPTPARSTGSRTGTGGARKRTRVPAIKRETSDEEDEDIEAWSDREETPTKRPRNGALPGQKNGTPTRRAAAMASATIAEAAARFEISSSEDHPEMDASTPTTTTASFAVLGPTESFPTAAAPVNTSPVSIFGAVDQKPFISRDRSVARGYRKTSYARTGADYLTGASDEGDIVPHNPYSELGDGEF